MLRLEVQTTTGPVHAYTVNTPGKKPLNFHPICYHMSCIVCKRRGLTVWWSSKEHYVVDCDHCQKRIRQVHHHLFFKFFYWLCWLRKGFDRDRGTDLI